MRARKKNKLLSTNTGTQASYGLYYLDPLQMTYVNDVVVCGAGYVY